jgi:hypothetical protein
MILNSSIWNEVISTAKASTANAPAWLRAVERGAAEIERARYWSFAEGVLTIISTTSGKTYRIDAHHTCEAVANGHTACRHRAARRLMQRYTERLAQTSSPAPLPAPAPKPSDLPNPQRGDEAEPEAWQVLLREEGRRRRVLPRDGLTTCPAPRANTIPLRDAPRGPHKEQNNEQ